MTQDKSSWKQIEQLLTSPAITPIAKRRRRFLLLKRIGIVLLAVFVLAGCVAGVWFLHANSRTLAPYAQKPQTDIVFFSDGQLSRSWFDERFPNLARKSLLSIDINAIQAALLRDSQVLSVTVERHFPSTLKITLRERRPIARVKVRENKQTQVYYLAPDGSFYTSRDYIAPVNLPFVSSAEILPGPNGLLPLHGIEVLAELIEGIKSRYPALAAEFQRIDLHGWTFPITDQTSVAIELRGGTSLRFAGQNISTQLDRLSEVLSLLADEKESLKNKTIDLTYPDRVAIVDK